MKRLDKEQEEIYAAMEASGDFKELSFYRGDAGDAEECIFTQYPKDDATNDHEQEKSSSFIEFNPTKSIISREANAAASAASTDLAAASYIVPSSSNTFLTARALSPLPTPSTPLPPGSGLKIQVVFVC